MRRALIVIIVLFAFLSFPVAPASPQEGVRHASDRFGASTNWAGYAVQTNLASPSNGVVTDVKGSWVVPAVSCPADGTNKYSAAWVGIDGYSSNSVEQLGTESDCLSGGSVPYYAAWWEMYPKPSRRIQHVVQAGDHMTAEVRYSGGNAYTLTMTDATQGWSFSTTQRAKAARSSAEWVQEAPWSGGVLPLSNFGTVTFTGASATIAGHTGTISDAAWQADRIDMVNGRGATKAQTSALDGTGIAFDVTWVSST
ncbi:MAG: G1 family glutamic endopeptidase [Candidatus Thermoplasmatota archaeon]